MTQNDPNDRAVEPGSSSSSSGGAKRKRDGESDGVRKSSKKEEVGAGDQKIEETSKSASNPTPGTLSKIQEKTAQDHNENQVGAAEDQEPEGQEIVGVDVEVVQIPWPYSLRTDTAEPLLATRLTFQNWTIDVANFRGNAPLSLSMDQLADGGVKMTIPGHLGCHNKMDPDLVTLRIWEGSHFWNINGNDVYLRIPPGFDLKETKISQNGDFVQIIAPRITQNQNQIQTQDQNQTQNQNQD